MKAPPPSTQVQIPASDAAGNGKRIALRLPLRTASGNPREHHFERSKRVRAERFAVGLFLNRLRPIELPCAVLLTRMGPNTKPLDEDGLQHSLKAIRDEVARWLGVDDGAGERRGLVTWVYAQVRAEAWGVQIECEADDGGKESEAGVESELPPLQGQRVGEGQQALADSVPAVFSADQAATRH